MRSRTRSTASRYASRRCTDIIRSKETANRLKDQAALPHLYALEDEIAARDAQSN